MSTLMGWIGFKYVLKPCCFCFFPHADFYRKLLSPIGQVSLRDNRKLYFLNAGWKCNWRGMFLFQFNPVAMSIAFVCWDALSPCLACFFCYVFCCGAPVIFKEISVQDCMARYAILGLGPLGLMSPFQVGLLPLHCRWTWAKYSQSLVPDTPTWVFELTSGLI